MHSNGYKFEPMPDDESNRPVPILETLLKSPGRIIHELHHRSSVTLAIWLLILGLVGMAFYGVIVGTLRGGAQLYLAPLKIAFGTLFAMIICFPSLYIFACLDGIEARVRAIAGMMFAAVCLAALLLIGFAPVAWIFSESTDSIPLMGALHLLFWLIGVTFGLRMLLAGSRLFGVGPRAHLRLWSIIFVLVCLQMTSTLRPIIGASKTLVPLEKKFFLAHWADCIAGRAER